LAISIVPAILGLVSALVARARYFASLPYREGTMRYAVIAASCTLCLLPTATPPIAHAPNATAPERISINDNRSSAGTLRDGILTIRLEVRDGDWRPDALSDPGLVVHAFAEEGKPLRVPGPLIRVPEGTEIHAFVRNTLLDSTLFVHGLSPRGVRAATDGDTIQIRPGEVREVRFTAGAAGTYYYWGSTRPGGAAGRAGPDSELSGAFIVDPRGTTGPARDRILLISLWTKQLLPGGLVGIGNLVRFSINGRAWPYTERLTYGAGDTVRFRVINTSAGVHPMHLHGFYFKVDSRGDGSIDTTYDRTTSPYFVVTERTTPGRTFMMTWVPERSGNWLFHCHDNVHVLRNKPFDGSPLPPEQMVHAKNHASEMMGGLVMGIEVRPRKATDVMAPAGKARQLRLVARVDSGGTDAEPAYGYELQEGGKTTSVPGRLIPGPTIVLKRGEPVSITVVNELSEPTAVHWHGIELDSYFDGVADFAGHPGRIAPAIAPRDSFVAMFTPPRSGTFMYHPHADEVRQQQAGLSGALIVTDSPATFDPKRDIVLLLTAPRTAADNQTTFVNGSKTPPALDLRVGERYRLRLVDIHTYRPSMIARLTRDSTLVTWRLIAKDGMDVPPERATVRPASQQMGNGETYDFEFAPTVPGDLRFTLTSGAGALIVAMPVRVR
jgi:FtsP/CotA-like multicopper oxidase with cupredoxin domain